MKCVIKALPVRCGDCLVVHFTATDRDKPYHIVIDTGYANTYFRTLKPIIKELRSKSEVVDLFIITHTDGDHIGGSKPLLADFGSSWFDHAWFNYAPAPYIIADESNEISISQGVSLRDCLLSYKKVNENPILAGFNYKLGPALLKVISPDKDQFERLLGEWRKEEPDPSDEGTIAVAGRDYNQSIKDLLENKYVPDTSLYNRSSIAFILQVGSTKALFTGDAHPEVLVASLRAQGYSSDKPILLEFMKVSHHGSKGNTSDELMDYIDCQHYLISSNADNKHQLPNKEALARVVCAAYKRHNDRPIHLYFTYKSELLEEIFTPHEQSQFLIQCHYPDTDGGGICFDYSIHE